MYVLVLGGGYKYRRGMRTETGHLGRGSYVLFVKIIEVLFIYLFKGSGVHMYLCYFEAVDS